MKEYIPIRSVVRFTDTNLSVPERKKVCILLGIVDENIVERDKLNAKKITILNRYKKKILSKKPKTSFARRVSNHETVNVQLS